jgi:NADP-dependent 3-hydroxy acid dehydrogenase YdfG
MTPSTADPKVVLISGASSGIGEATARLLAAAGHAVVLGARRTDRLRAITNDLAAAGGQASWRPLDVTDRASFAAFAEHAHAEHGRVDVLVNNAGLMPLSRLDALKLDEWDAMVDVNVRGVLHGIAACLPLMRNQGHGHVVNVASIGAHQVVPTAAVYCATKYAVWAISEGLRQEAGDRIRVTTVSPGVTESELAQTVTDPQARELMVAYRAVALPAAAIARAISFAIEEPADVDVNELVVRPTAQV